MTVDKKDTKKASKKDETPIKSSENMGNIGTDNYYVKLELTREMLGTNPISLDVMDKHIIDRQRKLISENSSVNKAINKYFMAKGISKEKADLELAALRLKIEEVLGTPLTEEEFEKMKAGEFKKLTDLRESMAELDEKGITCFFRNNKLDPNTKKERRDICIGNHMITGFLKAAAEAISKTVPKKNGTVMNSLTYTVGILNQHLSVSPYLISASNDVKRSEDGTPFYLQRPLRGMTPQGPRISLAKSEVLDEGTTFSFTLEVLKNSPLKEGHIKTLLSYGAIKGLGQWRGSGGRGKFKVVEFTKMPASVLS